MPRDSDGRLRIDQLAATHNTNRLDIEHFESIGLLTPERDETGSFYSSGDEVRLRIILKAKKLGFSEESIAAILTVAKWG